MRQFGLIVYLAIAISIYGVKCDVMTEPVDLSYGYDSETARRCPGGQDFEYLTRKVQEDPNGVWYALNTFAVAEHCGTHIDAPYHFDPSAITLENIPIKRLLTNGVLVNVSSEVHANENYTVPLSAMESWMAENGPLKENTVVLFDFGWAARYKDKDSYLGPVGKSRCPGISADLAKWIVDSGKIVGVGVDTATVDAGIEATYVVHKTFSSAGIYSLENVALHGVGLPKKFKLIVAPIKLIGGTGGPVRLIALPNEYTEF